MKKALLIASRVLLTIVLAFCIFKTCNILADTSIFQITKIEVKDKSEGVVVNSVGLSEGQLQNDIIFSAKDDYIKYNITIKNTSNDDYTIKSITDNNDSTNLEYTYEDLANIVVESKTEKTFELQIKYIEETTGLYISNKPVSLTLTYEKKDGSTGSETITNNDGTSSTTPASDLSEEDEDIVNPNTGDNINKYIIIGLLSMVGLIISITKGKQLFKTLVVVGLFATLAIPFGTKADTEAFIIKFNTNKIQNTHADLIKGIEINLLMSKLSSGIDTLEIYDYIVDDGFFSAIIDTNNNNEMYFPYNVYAFERATDEEYEAIKDSLTEENIISTSESNNPAYMWFDDNTGTIYYYSPAKALVMNEDSSYMFCEIANVTDLDLSDFDTINVTNMAWMFYDMAMTNHFVLGDNFDTSNVTNMSGMFSEMYDLTSLNLGDKFDTSNVTNMAWMFSEAPSLTDLNLGEKFDTSNVTNMSGMFTNASNLEAMDLGDKFDTSNVTDMSYMFDGIGVSELNLGSKFDTSNVSNMSFMFAFMQNLQELDLGAKFNTSRVSNMEEMFSNCNKLFTIYVASDFDLSLIQNDNNMFSYSEHLIGGDGSNYDYGYSGSEYARIDDPEHGYPGYFTLGHYDDEPINTEESVLFPGRKLNAILKDSSFSAMKPATSDLYEEIKDSLSNIIISTKWSVPTYIWLDESSNTIYYYSEAERILMNVDSSEMFAHVNINEIDLSGFDTSNVTDMSDMFGYAMMNKLNLGDHFNTSNVTDMSGMFSGTYMLDSLDLGDNFDTSNVTNMSYMFAGDSDFSANYTTLDLGDKFDTSKVTNMSRMFYRLYNITELDLGDNFDTSNVTNMSFMFADMLNLEAIDLGDKFNTSNVTDMSYMFQNDINLKTIYTASSFYLTSLQSSANMFYHCYKIVGGAGTQYSESHYPESTISAAYARIDNPEYDRPGYFTLRQQQNIIIK
ncbi:MAG: BspA family leucine-rich repeat surface protein [Bacilli bacterium]|nr:BspA family leucine-rich repeat surface protein [Bacilli bacterium]